MQDFRLKVFQVTAEHLSFTKAAQRLYLTQPAVTLQIKNLEQDLGTRLFDRAGGRVRLTPAGQLLLDYARRIEQLYEEARRDIGAITREVRGTLSLGVSTTISQYVLPHVLAGFRQAQPGIQVLVMSANTERVLAALGEGKIELGLIEGPPGGRGVKLEKFLDDEIVLIVPREHPWAVRRRALDPSELQKTPLLLREQGSGTRRVVEAALRSAGLDIAGLEVPMSLDSTEAIKSAVEAGLGVGLVSRWAVRDGGSLAVVPLEGLEIRRTFNFVYAQGPPPSGVAGLFLRYAIDAAARLAPARRASAG